MIGNTFLPGVVDDSCLVDLHLGGRPAVWRVSDAPPYGVVVEAEVVLTAIQSSSSSSSSSSCRAKHCVTGSRVVGGVERRSAHHPAGSEGLGMVTTGVSF